MQVILTEDVDRVGTIGDIVNVKPGFARNFLFPRKLAIEASAGNVRQSEHQQRLIDALVEKRRAESGAVADRLAHLAIEIAKRAGEEDKIFGSVTTSELAEHLAKHGIEIDRHNIEIAEHIRTLGDYKASVHLGHGVTAEMNFRVVAEAEEEQGI